MQYYHLFANRHFFFNGVFNISIRIKTEYLIKEINMNLFFII